MVITRFHYRGHVATTCPERMKLELEECTKNVKHLIEDNKLMTCALYYHEDMLYLYYECIGEEFTPDTFMSPLSSSLHTWPTKKGLSHWAYMNHIYYHSISNDSTAWKRTSIPEQRRGRIAYLKKDKLFSYVYHHVAIVDEGLLQGDKYQSIALHEDILFSYFEEPKKFTNIQEDLTTPSKAIEHWLAVDPESHFTPLEGANGANFLFLPSYFTLGQE